ncbi:hypothetical protein NDU88_001790 [Pleurodeles waltl]|uniref:Uncharacterized protein n=1 Tax=Pleurodeles waltl TaxID=8319 RepID=A0AAV7VAS7_PLEWA|nr:hypothetical protein NDU88_001790 [Pleurodeles waltl]
MSDDYVQRALALLEKAGRMDLVNRSARGQGLRQCRGGCGHDTPEESMQWGPRAPSTEAAMHGELRQQVVSVLVSHGQDALEGEEWDLDFNECSVEEGELSEGWEEEK